MERLMRITPEKAGIGSEQMVLLLKRLMHRHTQMNGFMAARDGKVFAECWWKPYGPDLVHSNHSMGKSYTCTAIGIAEQEGILCLDEKVTDIFREEIEKAGIVPEEKMKKITIRHVLTMTNGMAVHPKMNEDWICEYFRTPVDYLPGTRFLYNSSGSCLLGAILYKKTGMGLKEYLTPRLFEKIGIDADRFIWLDFPDKIDAEPGTFATTEDNLRLGMLYCGYGKWQGEQILSERFVREALSVQTDTSYAPEQKDGKCGYGYQLWACSRPGVYRFDGGQGQFGILWPEKKLVVSIHEGAMMPYGPQATLDAVYECLFDVIGEEALEENREAYGYFRSFAESLAMPEDLPDEIPRHEDLTGRYSMISGEIDPWMCVAPPGKGDFFKLFREKERDLPVREFAIAEEEDSYVFGFGEHQIRAYKDGKWRIRKIRNVLEGLDDYCATARFINGYTLEITIHWMESWTVTQLRFEKLAGYLYTKTMHLRLNEEDNWLVRSGTARRKEASMEKGKIVLLPGEPNDKNREYLPEAIRGSDMVVNENGNNSQVFPPRLKEYKECIVAGEGEDVWYEYVPANYDPERKTPLVISCHGGLMTGWGQCIYTSWSHVADREGFIVVFPDAHSQRMWQIAFDPAKKEALSKPIPGLPQIALQDGPISEYHDVKLLLGLMERMQEKYNIDQGRIYIQGMSMGNAMASQMARQYGYLFAGAAGSGCPTDTSLLFDEEGKVKNTGGPLDIMVSRLEHDVAPPYYSLKNKDTLMENYRYWKLVNGCTGMPEISVRGDYNFIFFHGEKARFSVMDVKNRDHGQTFDDAEYVWDYNFSGVRRKGDGTLEHTGCEKERKGDKMAIAVAEGCDRAWVNGEIVPVNGRVFSRKKVKYHGLGGKEIVRGEYLYVPAAFCGRLSEASLRQKEDGSVCELDLRTGEHLQFAKGSVGCVADNRVESMLCEAVHQDGTLYLPLVWFAERFWGAHCSDCEQVTYITDHPARISTYTAWILKSMLGGEYGVK